MAVPGCPLPTFSTASAARAFAVLTAAKSSSLQPTVSARGAGAFNVISFDSDGRCARRNCDHYFRLP